MPIDEHALTELELYADNDGDLYRQRTLFITKNLEKKVAKGIYDHEKAVVAFRHLADEAAKRYAKEFASARDWNKLFNVDTRQAFARRAATYFENELKAQGIVAKKNRATSRRRRTAGSRVAGSRVACRSRPRSVCRCGAYHFPHASGGGACRG